MTDAEPDPLAVRLDAIEARPLAERAAAYAALHDELTAALHEPPPIAAG